MTRTAGLSLPVVKEIRALAMAWLACLVTMIAGAVLATGFFRSLGVSAYFFGAAALGAVSIGHEYNHRTLATLLVQPARRERLLLAKLGVLLAMLLSLSVVAAVILFNPAGLLRAPRSVLQGGYVSWALWLPVLGGLTVAPLLTMLCRNPIAGTVFTVSAPALLLLAGDLLGMAVYGRFAPEVEGFRWAFFRVSATGLLAMAAVLGWRRFMRLEAIDGRDADVRMPAFAAKWFQPARRSATERTGAKAGALRRHTPLWLLVKKELHLQGIAYVVAALYLLGWMAMVAVRQPQVQMIDTMFNGLTVFYAFLLSLLIGALASAEERQLGTLEWQAMLPVATSAQWIAKVAVVMGVTLVLSMGLPLLLSVLNYSLDLMGGTSADIVNPMAAAALVIVSVSGLYVSSLCASGIQALLIAVAATPGVVLFISFVLMPLGRGVFAWSSQLTGQFPALGMRAGDWRVASSIALLLGAAFLPVALWFALVNHRSAERGAARVLKQLAWIAGSAAIAVALWAALAGAIR